MPLNISGSIVNATMADTLDTEGVIKRGLRVHLDPDSLGTASGESIAGDISGNNNNSTVAHMKTGTAVSFDGSNDYVLCATGTGGIHSKITTAITIAAWAYKDASSSAYRAIVESSDASDHHFDLAISATDNPLNRELFFYLTTSAGSGYAYFGTAFPIGSWHHVVGTWDGSTIKVYQDGVIGSTNASLGGTFAGEFDSNTQLDIGMTAYGPQEFFDGDISDVKIFNTALTAAQISELYRSPGTTLPEGVSASALVGWWPLSEGSGTIAFDGSGNNNHGTLTNGPTWIGGQADIRQLAGRGNSFKTVFDESNDYATNGSFVKWGIADKWSVSFWMYMTSTALQTMFSLQESGDANNKIEVLTNNGAREIFVNNSGGVGTSSPTHHQADTANSVWSTNTWTHVVVTNNGGTGALTGVYAIYVNGASQSVVINSGTQTHPMDNSSRKLRIGGDVAGGRYVGGILDEVAMWNTDLDDAAVTALYNSHKPLDARKNSGNYDKYEDNLVGYWRNDSPGTWKDLSGNGNHLTVNGSPLEVFFPEGTTKERDSQGILSKVGMFNFTGFDSSIRINVNSWIRTVSYVTITGWWYHWAHTGGAPFDIMTDTGGADKDGFWWHPTYSNNTDFYLRTEDNSAGEADTSDLSTSLGHPISVGNWYHTAVAVGTNRFKVYFDGSLYYSWRTNESYSGHAANAFSWANINSDTAYLWVGASYGTSIKGIIGNVQLYDRELSVAEIQHNMNVGRDRYGV